MLTVQLLPQRTKWWVKISSPQKRKKQTISNLKNRNFYEQYPSQGRIFCTTSLLLKLVEVIACVTIEIHYLVGGLKESIFVFFTHILKAQARRKDESFIFEVPQKRGWGLFDNIQHHHCRSHSCPFSCFLRGPLVNKMEEALISLVLCNTSLVLALLLLSVELTKIIIISH